jgi:hypothetical protein
VEIGKIMPEANDQPTIDVGRWTREPKPAVLVTFNEDGTETRTPVVRVPLPEIIPVTEQERR